MPSIDATNPPCQVTLSRSQPYPDPIPGIIPFGTVTLFAGAPGVGKTAMLAEWCRRWRDGLTICGHPTNRPTGFYYLAADRQWQSHQQWFDLVNFPDIAHYSLADDRTLDLAQLQRSGDAHKCLLAAVARLSPIPGSSLLIDPVSPLFIIGDPNRARDVAASLLRISRLAQVYQINIICTAHFGKQKADPKDQYTRPQDRIAGSGAFSGFSDTQIYLIDPLPPKQPYHILGWTPRHAAPEEFQFVRNEHGLFVPYELFKELDRIEAVYHCIPKTPTPTNMIIRTIITALGLADATAERYLHALVSDGRVVKVRRGVYRRANPS